jgi:hypothetical protein
VVGVPGGLDGLRGAGGLRPDAAEVLAPALQRPRRVAFRQRVTAGADVEQEAGGRAEVVREKRPVGVVEGEDAPAHGEVFVPPAELHVGAGEGVVPLHDGGVERWHPGRVQEVEQVRGRGAQALDARPVECLDRRQDMRLGVATQARVEEPAEGELVVAVLVDIRDAQLRLPEEGVVGALEDLALLRDGVDNRLQRGASVRIAEGAGPDLLDDGLDAAPDRAEVLDTLLPQEPRPVGSAGILAPVPEELADPGFVHVRPPS